MPIIIGIDPGSQRTGWGIIDPHPQAASPSQMKCIDHGVIEVDARSSVGERLAQISLELEEIMTKYKPTAMSVEKVFLGKNVDSAFKLGQARGVVLALAGYFKIPVYEYATRKIKKIVAGHGDAEKEQVRFMVEQFLGIKVKGLDASDALALAIGHCFHSEVTERLRQQTIDDGV